MEWINKLSLLVQSHQLLVLSVIVPTVSAVIAWLSSWYSTRRALKTEQNKMQFTAAVKFAEFQHQKINALTEALSEFQSFGVLPNHNPSAERQFYKLGTKIELLMNPDNPDYAELQKLMYGFLGSAGANTSSKYDKNAEFVQLSQNILRCEWDLLRLELDNTVSK